jgi:hypothetical protein
MAHYPKASLLGLPLETRFDILREVIFDNPRPSPSGPQELETKGFQIHPVSYWHLPQHEMVYEGEPPRNPAMPLLLTCRQLQSETLALLHSRSFKSQRLPRCKLDMVYLTDCTLWVTWLNLPRLEVTHVDELHVQLRAFKHPTSETPQAWSCRRLGDMFSSIMLNFLKVGPVTSWRSRRPKTPLFIGRLVLDFLSVEDGKDIMPRDMAMHDMLTKNWRVELDRVEFLFWQKAEDAAGNGVLEAANMKVLGAILVPQLFRVLSEGCRAAPDDRGRFHRQIGEIEYRLAGEFVATFDTAKSLERLPDCSCGWKLDGEEQFDDFLELGGEVPHLKEQIRATRIAAGFPVVPEELRGPECGEEFGTSTPIYTLRELHRKRM